MVAVDDVSFSVSAGKTFAIAGESACGKTTPARMVLRLIEPDAGELRFEGRDLLKLGGGELRAARRWMQMVFQGPFASLNPRMRERLSRSRSPFMRLGWQKMKDESERRLC